MADGGQRTGVPASEVTVSLPRAEDGDAPCRPHGTRAAGGRDARTRSDAWVSGERRTGHGCEPGRPNAAAGATNGPQVRLL